MFLMAGTPHFHIATSSTKNASEPQMISLGSGVNGDGAFWQSSIVPPLSSFLMHFSAASFAGFDVVSASCANAGPATAPSATTTPSAATNARMRLRTSFPLARDDERKDESEERKRFGERDTEEHGGSHGAGGLRLSGHRRDRVSDDQADADAGADGRAAVDDASTDRSQPLVVVDCSLGEEMEQSHVGSPCFFLSVRDAWIRRCTRR